MEWARRSVFQSRKPRLLSGDWVLPAYHKHLWPNHAAPSHFRSICSLFRRRKLDSGEACVWECCTIFTNILINALFQLIDISHSYVEYTSWLIDRIARLFNRCSRIQSLHLGANLFAHQPNFLHKSIKNIVIDEFTWSNIVENNQNSL